LGYRNFADFPNRYRLADATAALADPSQDEVPILTITLDAGFASHRRFRRRQLRDGAHRQCRHVAGYDRRPRSQPA
jgi:hypothetical protein